MSVARMFYRMKDVLALTGLARSTIYLMIKNDEFPSPVLLGQRAVGWRASDVDQWVEVRMARRVEKVAPAPEQPAATDIASLVRNSAGLTIQNTGCGVYFACDGDEIVYIGSSTDIAARIHDRTHPTKGRRITAVYWRAVPQSALREVESALIRANRPRYNGKHPNGVIQYPVSENERRPDAKILAAFVADDFSMWEAA